MLISKTQRVFATKCQLTKVIQTWRSLRQPGLTQRPIIGPFNCMGCSDRHAPSLMLTKIGLRSGPGHKDLSGHARLSPNCSAFPRKMFEFSFTRDPAAMAA